MILKYWIESFDADLYLKSKKISCRACLLFYLFFLFDYIKKILFQSSFNLYLPKLPWNSRDLVVNILEMVYSIKSFCKVSKYNSCKELVIWSLHLCYLKAIWINVKFRTETRFVVMQNVVLKYIEQYHLFLLFKKAL